MGRHARERRAMASAPIVFSNPTTTSSTSNNDTVIGYQCTCYRRRCRCGASGVRVLDANSMAAPTRMMAMNQSSGYGYGYGYDRGFGAGYGGGCGYGRRGRRRQGPITALVGGLINLAIEKHGEHKEKAAREAAEEQHRAQPTTTTTPTTTREGEEAWEDDSETEYEDEQPQRQTQGVEPTRRPEIAARTSSRKSEKGEKSANKLRKNGVLHTQQRSEQLPHPDTAPPPYSA